MIFSRIWIAITIFFRLMHVTMQLMYGAWKVMRLSQPIVTIFGGARFSANDRYSHQAAELAHLCMQHGVSVLTGGGAGIMKAARGGVMSHTPSKKDYVLNIGVVGLDTGVVPTVGAYIELDYFFARKWLLTNYSQAFAVFPGGFGTLNELSELLMLMRTNMLPRTPIVLIGTEYWTPFMNWLWQEMVVHGTIDSQDCQLFTVTDDVKKAFEILCKTCQEERS